MVKILLLSDFHGVTLPYMKRIVSTNDIDLILSPGDYCGNAEWSKLFFKYMYGKPEDTRIPLRVRSRMWFLEKKSFFMGLRVLRNIKKLGVPFLGIMGNWDPAPYGKNIHDFDIETNRLLKMKSYEGPGFEFIDLGYKELRDVIIIGGASSTAPEKATKPYLKKLRDKYELTRKELKKYERAYAFRVRKYKTLFSRAKKKGKRVIFLTHNCPYDTKLDTLGAGPMKGEHYGSFMDRDIILRYKPDLVICGHIHENVGKCTLGKSLVVNAGAVMDGRYGLVEFDSEKGVLQIKLKKV
ncbi:MAG: Icc-related predicted phosphoesterase [Patescibacteria group bacterium]|jgi:Icc-related predicted phosphoesterase